MTERRPTAAEARAAVEARRAEDRAAREAVFAERYGDRLPGRPIMAVSWACTAVLTAVTALAVVEPDAVGAFLAVAMTAFFLGCGLFAVVLVLAAARSREDAMGIGGLFFLAGSAPRRVQWQLLGSLGVQTVVAVGGAAARPFTPLAFGTLTPMIGLSLCGLWSVRHGLFPPRPPDAGGPPVPGAVGRDA